MSWLRENWFKVGILALIFLAIWIFGGIGTSETKNKWQAVYYPDGCLLCEDNYIWSPFFESINECINWVHVKAETRNNSNDSAECAINCKESDVFDDIKVCEDTVDVLGNPSL